MNLQNLLWMLNAYCFCTSSERAPRVPCVCVLAVPRFAKRFSSRQKSTAHKFLHKILLTNIRIVLPKHIAHKFHTRDSANTHAKWLSNTNDSNNTQRHWGCFFGSRSRRWHLYTVCYSCYTHFFFAAFALCITDRRRRRNISSPLVQTQRMLTDSIAHDRRRSLPVERAREREKTVNICIYCSNEATNKEQYEQFMQIWKLYFFINRKILISFVATALLLWQNEANTQPTFNMLAQAERRTGQTNLRRIVVLIINKSWIQRTMAANGTKCITIAICSHISSRWCWYCRGFWVKKKLWMNLLRVANTDLHNSNEIVDCHRTTPQQVFRLVYYTHHWHWLRSFELKTSAQHPAR